MKVSRYLSKVEQLATQLASLSNPSEEQLRLAQSLLNALKANLLHPSYREFLETHLQGMIWKFRWQRMVQNDLTAIITRSVKQRNYAITTPPRHGKTSLVTIPLPAFFLHHYPTREVIVAMHSQGIANKISKRTRAIVREDIGLGDLKTLKEWETSQGGQYKATGVGGYIAGRGGHLLIADDLFPDRKHAESQVYRDSVHDWWQDDFITRRNPSMGAQGQVVPIVLIMTRWHTDDIWGRVVNEDEWLIRRMPAVCDYDPLDPDAAVPCPIGRSYGDPLAPQMWSLKDLRQIEKGMSRYSWLALYQGRPTSKAGMFFDVEALELCEGTPPDVINRVRYFDFASSPDPDAAFTASVLMAEHADGTYTIEHMDKIQKGPSERNQWQRRLANMDARIFGAGRVTQVEERQPSAAGRDRVIAWAKLMRGHSVAVDKIEGQGDKTTRADPCAGAMGAGLMRLRTISPFGRRNPVRAYKDELRSFPLGKSKDWVDATSGAYNYFNRKRGKGTTIGKRKGSIIAHGR